MTKVVTAAEANRQFSKLLREVEGGTTVIITSHGHNVAKISPVDDEGERCERRSRSLKEHLARLRERPAGAIPKWTREELYEDEPYPQPIDDQVAK